MTTDTLIFIAAAAWFVIGYAVGRHAERQHQRHGTHDIIALAINLRDQLNSEVEKGRSVPFTYVGGPWDGDSRALRADAPVVIHGSGGVYRQVAEAHCYIWEPEGP